MPSSLHVSLPDEMRDYVDNRTNGTRDFSTPSEYVRSLIRADMEKEIEFAYIQSELRKSQSDIDAGRVLNADQVKASITRILE